MPFYSIITSNRYKTKCSPERCCATEYKASATLHVPVFVQVVRVSRGELTWGVLILLLPAKVCSRSTLWPLSAIPRIAMIIVLGCCGSSNLPWATGQQSIILLLHGKSCKGILQVRVAWAMIYSFSPSFCFNPFRVHQQLPPPVIQGIANGTRINYYYFVYFYINI